jgi:tetratricopeptide (TPR) repeat protein
MMQAFQLGDPVPGAPDWVWEKVLHFDEDTKVTQTGVARSDHPQLPRIRVDCEASEILNGSPRRQSLYQRITAHPVFPALLGAYSLEGVNYFIREYQSGRTLDDLKKETANPAASEWIETVFQKSFPLIDGLWFGHSIPEVFFDTTPFDWVVDPSPHFQFFFHRVFEQANTNQLENIRPLLLIITHGITPTDSVIHPKTFRLQLPSSRSHSRLVKSLLQLMYSGWASEISLETFVIEVGKLLGQEPLTPRLLSRLGPQPLPLQLTSVIHLEEKPFENPFESPDDAQALAREAGVLRLKDQNDDALRLCERALKLDPNCVDALFQRGEIFRYTRHELDRAIRDFDKAISIDPKHVNSISSRGKAYSDREEYARAVEDFNRAVELSPHYTWVRTQRGIALRFLDRYPEAIADFTTSIEQDPKSTQALYNRAESYRMSNKPAEAIVDCTRCLEVDPTYHWAKSTRGRCYFDLDKYDEALKDYTDVLEQAPDYHWARAQRGIVYRFQAKYEEAIADFDYVLRHEPDHVQAWFNRGESNRLLKRFDQAIADCTQALRINPKYFWAMGTRGASYRGKGEFRQAILDLQGALEIEPNYQFAKDQLKRAKERSRT